MPHRIPMDLKEELKNYGITGNNIRQFHKSATPDLIEYLDLIEPRSTQDEEDVLPDGVVENQGHPLLFFLDESRLTTPPCDEDDKFKRLSRTLACRGDRAYLARVRPGELLVTPVNLSDRTPEWKPYRAGTGEALTFFSRLVLGHFDGKGEPDEADFVFKGMFNLLAKGADRLANILDGPADVLSLVGRVLFFRFLCDRHIVRECDAKLIALKASDLFTCFDNADNAYATSQWLDQTFNGNFLPLTDNGSLKFFKGIKKEAFKNLNAIVNVHEPVGEEDYQLKLPMKWSDFDFAHVPVGLLSQVYEAFCWKWDHKQAKETSVLYTPRRIAATLVDEAFDGLPNAQEARVLDPACGAGVFLVLAFRRLYRELWLTGDRPNTKVIREILEKQLTGFDISDSALKLSALSLYLTAIELDPQPIPPEKLRFKVLNNLVLFNHRRKDADPHDGPVIGSLGKHIGSRFDRQFDLVLSNPPWTKLPKDQKSLADELTTVSKSIIKRKVNAKLSFEYQNPDFAPDLPFLWKSTEWCKSNGRIAMALPARILFKQEKIPSRARKTLFQLLEVTGVINGSNLSDTEVWPKMGQPFIMLFARNCPPKRDQILKFITPHYDKLLNRKGEMRIDSKSAKPVKVDLVNNEPWTWKALAVGTSLDIEVIRRVKSAQGLRLKDYWKTSLKLTNSRGYETIPSQEQSNSRFLIGLPNLTADYNGRFSVDIGKLKLFKRPTACRPRNRDIYRSPLVLVKQSPGLQRENCWAFLSFDDIAFSRDYYGYSTAGHPNKELLAQYLFLFCHSLIWIHYALMTGPVFGAERRVIYKKDLDDCPVIPLERLNNQQHSTVSKLSKKLLRGDRSVFPEIDLFFSNLYNLDELDQEVIQDTIEVCMPYKESRERGFSPPNEVEREALRKRLESILHPFFKVLGKEPQVVVWGPDDMFLQNKATFGFVYIIEQGKDIQKPDELILNMILNLANETGTSSVIQEISGGLLIGILNQYRYWTRSRARILGAEIVRQYISVFEE